MTHYFLGLCDSSSINCSLSLCNRYMVDCLSLLISQISFNVLDNNTLSCHDLNTHIPYCLNFTVVKKSFKFDGVKSTNIHPLFVFGIYHQDIIFPLEKSLIYIILIGPSSLLYFQAFTLSQTNRTQNSSLTFLMIHDP